jgi:hypothetical protein
MVNKTILQNGGTHLVTIDAVLDPVIVNIEINSSFHPYHVPGLQGDLPRTARRIGAWIAKLRSCDRPREQDQFKAPKTLNVGVWRQGQGKAGKARGGR